MSQLCGAGDIRLTKEQYENLTYRELWEVYVEPALPPETDPEEDRKMAEANAIAAAIMAGADLSEVQKSLEKDRQ